MVSASEYPRNELGMTYGPQHLPGSSPVGGTQIDPETYGPDLVLTFGDDGTLGYTKRADLNGPMPRNPAEAAAMIPVPRSVPLYSSDGVTVIGTFTIGSGQRPAR